jgi:alpha-D-xyloside xylohydrolase
MQRYISVSLGALALACALGAGQARADAVTARLDSSAGLALSTERGVLRLDPWSDAIIHVKFGAPDFAGNYNPAVIATPEKVDYRVSETAAAWVLATGKLSVEVDKATARISFFDTAHHLLLAEGDRDTGLGARQDFLTKTPLYGLGQHQNGLLDYTGATIHLQQANTDVGVPMMVSPQGFGLLWNNASVMDVDVGVAGKPPLEIRNETGPGIDYDFIAGPEVHDIIAGYRWLTGDAPMMARWTWGMWQSKEHYATQDELISIPAHYRKMGVPVDAVVQDWQYWQAGQWGGQRMDPARYPDPKTMVQAIHDMHVHTIISVWPRFDLGTDTLAELDAAGAVLPGVYPNVYPPGWGRWYDAWNPKGRDIYWRQIMSRLGVYGFDGWWLDGDEAELGGGTGEMREIATAAGPGIQVNNAFPLMHTTAVHDGMMRDQPDKRVFILSRSAYAGQQRNGVITWSGDTHASWETLRKQIPAALNFSMSGIPYWSADIGGFFSPDQAKDPSYAELFIRWHQFGVFNPMFRIHGAGDGKEIWTFDAATQKILIDDVRLRYRLLPYIYATSWDVTAHQGTMMRALAFDFRSDSKALAVTDEYMFGKTLLVAPVLEAGAKTRGVYLPGTDGWYDVWTGAAVAGGQTVAAATPLDHIPLYARAGSILPLGPVKPYADAPSKAPTELRVFPGRDGDFTWYDDTGDGYGYQKGQYVTIAMSWNDKTHSLTLGARQGQYPGMPSRIAFRVTCRADGGGRIISYEGAEKIIAMPQCY